MRIKDTPTPSGVPGKGSGDLFKRSVWILLLGFVMAGSQVTQAGYIFRNFYDSITGARMADLRDQVRDPANIDNLWPNFPEGDFIIVDPVAVIGLQNPDDDPAGDPLLIDNYATLYRGYIFATMTGPHTFFVASDDDSEFYLSTDHTKANLQGSQPFERDGDGILLDNFAPIAYEIGCCTALFSGDRLAERSSDPIELVAGNWYYFEAAQKEGGGGSWIQVGWEKPNGVQEIIPSYVLAPVVADDAAVEIVNVFDIDTFNRAFDSGVPSPAGATIDETGSAVLEVNFNAVQPATFKWFKDGTEIPDSNAPFYHITAAVAADAGEYSVEVTDANGSSATSGPAVVEVIADTVAPAVELVDHRGNPNGLRVLFTEPVDQASAEDLANYELDGGALTIDSAVLLADGQSVDLRGNWDFQLDSTHSLSVSNVKDLAEAENVLDPNPTVTEFDYANGTFELFDFNDGVPPELTLFGTAGVVDSGGPDGSGYLRITDAVNSQLGAAKFNLVRNVRQVIFDFDVRVDFGTPRPADGFSFNVATDLPDGTYPQSEEGYNAGDSAINAQGLMIAFDNWDSGAADNGPGYEVKYLGQSVGFVPSPDIRDGVNRVENGIPSISRDGWVHCQIKIKLNGKLDLTYDGYTIFDNLDIGFQGIDNAQVGFGGRTGGANESHHFDNLQVGFAGGKVGPVLITRQPASVTGDERFQTIIDVIADGAEPYSYQWFKDGTEIAGATSRSYSFIGSPDDSGEYTVRVNNEFSEILSDPATVVIDADTTPASVVSVDGSGSGTSVFITVDEPVTAASAETLGNYSIVEEGGDPLEVTGAVLGANGRTITLTTAPVADATRYELTIQGLVDTSVAGNVTPTSTHTYNGWAVSRGAVSFNFYGGTGGTAVQALLDDPNYPLNPNPAQARLLTSFDAPNGIADNFGAAIWGWFHPDVSGDYRFHIRSDDASQLFLNPNGPEAVNPLDGATPIAREDGCCGGFEAAGAPETSEPIALEAGTAYYILLLYKEGGGGDWAQVAARREGDDTALAPIPGSLLSTRKPVADAPSIGGASPADGAFGVDLQPDIRVTIIEGVDRVNRDTIQVAVDGTVIPHQVADEGNDTVVTADIPAAFDEYTEHSYVVSWENTANPPVAGSASGSFTVTGTPVLEPSLGGATFEFFPGTGGTAVADLYADPNFPDNPASSRVITSFSTPNGLADNYGARVRAIFVAPVDGDYHFFIASDDASELYFNPLGEEEVSALTGDFPIAFEAGCCAAFPEIDSGDDATSATSFDPFTLVAGGRYYIEATLKEGGGGDWMNVAYRVVGDDTPAADLQPIPGRYLETIVNVAGISFEFAGLTNQRISALGEDATFDGTAIASVQGDKSKPVWYQWQRNDGGGFADIEGAEGPTYTITGATQADVDATFRVIANVVGGTAVSPEVGVSIGDPIEDPTISVQRLGNGDLEVTFAGGILEVATDVNGPYVAVPDATSPFTITPDQDSQFARVRGN